jgi:hypothetical protein
MAKSLTRQQVKNRQWNVIGESVDGVLKQVPIDSRQLAVLMDIRAALNRMDRRLRKLERAAESR